MSKMQVRRFRRLVVDSAAARGGSGVLSRPSPHGGKGRGAVRKDKEGAAFDLDDLDDLDGGTSETPADEKRRQPGTSPAPSSALEKEDATAKERALVGRGAGASAVLSSALEMEDAAAKERALGRGETPSEATQVYLVGAPPGGSAGVQPPALGLSGSTDGDAPSEGDSANKKTTSAMKILEL